MAILFPEAWPEILYWGRGGSNHAPPHVHSFFQLEIGIRGVFRGISDDDAFEIGPGDCWLIAPEELHGFRESGGEFEFVSIKFNFPNFTFHRRNTAVTAQLAANIVSLLSGAAPTPFPDASYLRLLSGQIYLLLQELHRDAKARASEAPPLLRAIAEAVLRRGYKLNVNLLADELKLTLSQLKYQFRKANNTASPNLKHYLDSLLIFAAGNHLRYSDLKPGAIAQLLNFPDVYTFSRFFKHRTGLTPRAFRSLHHDRSDAGEMRQVFTVRN